MWAIEFDCLNGDAHSLVSRDARLLDQERLLNHEQNRGSGKRLIRSTEAYNCVGLVFGARRGWLVDETDDDSISSVVATMLDHDGFERIGAYAEVTTRDLHVQPGDVVVYTSGSSIEHVGIVAKETGLGLKDEPMVVSKFGPFGEYLHRAGDVGPLFGSPSSIWRQKFEDDLEVEP